MDILFIANATLADWLGSLAGICTTVAFLPQVLRTWRTGSARDLSLGWLVTFTTGVALWLVYGLMTHALPLIVANIVTLLLVGTLLAMKLHSRG